MYRQVYAALCDRGKSKAPGENIHAHHITPKHAGGTDEKNNITYLSVREHIIAHYLLWKIDGRPNDLRAMSMLGARLTTHQRRVVGLYCAEHKIGFHGASQEDRLKWNRKSLDVMREKRLGMFGWTDEQRKQFNRLGGKASWESENNHQFKFWASPEGRIERARRGAAVSAKLPVTNGTQTKKFKTQEERLNFLTLNPSWWSGHRSYQRKSSALI